jgi:hypothetical protein
LSREVVAAAQDVHTFFALRVAGEDCFFFLHIFFILIHPLHPPPAPARSLAD